jgi:hypothetical protein
MIPTSIALLLAVPFVIAPFVLHAALLNIETNIDDLQQSQAPLGQAIAFNLESRPRPLMVCWSLFDD